MGEIVRAEFGPERALSSARGAIIEAAIEFGGFDRVTADELAEHLVDTLRQFGQASRATFALELPPDASAKLEAELLAYAARLQAITFQGLCRTFYAALSLAEGRGCQ